TPGDPLARVRPPRLPDVEGRSHRFDLRPLARGLVRPTWVGTAPGQPGALWALEQSGRVVRIEGGRRRTVIDLRDEVKVGAERGLLAAAFHPDFARNRRLVLHFTNRRGDTRVIELGLPRRRGREPTRRLLLAERQPEENHNGGTVAFGPDGRLYLALGDGGGAFDPRRNAQDPRSRLGKILYADTDAPGPPRWRVLVLGLRNPWRFSFDAGLNEMWIGDVGQDAAEEIDRIQVEPDEPPKNLGWGPFEGTTRVRRGGHRLQRGELVWPVAAYRHRRGRCSVTAGLVYRGSALPALAGRYVYGDFCTGELWSLRPKPGKGAEDLRIERARVPQLTHIGADGKGELVMASSSGTVYRAHAAARRR
ncbi:MAG: PQQ-dependent sugar dehydrogenase, partial [Actinomycetota bacterium]|nr:PQQ-dependent sugar dehydrogenase [Actinomycetota bacterium]